MAGYAFKGNSARIYTTNSTEVRLYIVFGNIYFPVTKFLLIIVTEKKWPNERKFEKSCINKSHLFNLPISYNFISKTNLTIRAIYV